MVRHSTFAGWSDFRLAAANLAIGRGERTLASRLCFSLAGGQALVVSGRNGAGKSTLLRTLAGLLPALGGTISVAGEGLEAGEPAGQRAHFLGHADGMKSTLSVRENLEFWAAMLDVGAGGLSAREALEAVELPHTADFPAAYLSAGQKRRVALARLLVAHRPLWLLDEPTTALDAAAQARFAGIARAHLARGGIVIAATHAPLDLDGAIELGLDALSDDRTGG